MEVDVDVAAVTDVLAAVELVTPGFVVPRKYFIRILSFFWSRV